MTKSIFMVIGLCISIILTYVYLGTIVQLKENVNKTVTISTQDKSYLDDMNIKAHPIYTKYDIALAGAKLNKNQNLSIKESSNYKVLNWNQVESLLLYLENTPNNKKFYSTIEYDSKEDKLITKFSEEIT